jgi:hypothetical protein
VHTTVHHAPRLAIRVFPEIVVVSGGVPLELGVADALAAHLARNGRARVLRVDRAQLELRHASGTFGPATAILSVEARIDERIQSTWDRRPRSECPTDGGMSGTLDATLAVDASVRLRVTEARTTRVLQELELREREVCGDPETRRARAVARVRARALEVVDATQAAAAIALEDVDHPDVRLAIVWAREGRAHRARLALEAIANEESFHGRGEDERARILFDLGQALRLEARTGERMGVAELAAADRALRAALALERRTPYYEAVAEVAVELAAAERMREFDEATSTNFAMALPHDLPSPPPGYGYAMAH